MHQVRKFGYQERFSFRPCPDYTYNRIFHSQMRMESHWDIAQVQPLLFKMKYDNANLFEPTKKDNIG